MTWKFKEWYQKNKEPLSVKRKARYRTDPEYRQKALDASALRRLSKPTVERHGLTVSEVGNALGVSLWRLSKWKEKQYIPLQSFRSYQFTTMQVSLIKMYVDFFELHKKTK